MFIAYARTTLPIHAAQVRLLRGCALRAHSPPGATVTNANAEDPLGERRELARERSAHESRLIAAPHPARDIVPRMRMQSNRARARAGRTPRGGSRAAGGAPRRRASGAWASAPAGARGATDRYFLVDRARHPQRHPSFCKAAQARGEHSDVHVLLHARYIRLLSTVIAYDQTTSNRPLSPASLSTRRRYASCADVHSVRILHRAPR